MNRFYASIARLLTAALVVATAAACLAQDNKAKVDPTGTWTWTTTGQGGQTRTSTLKLKLDGDKLTGTMMGRQNETAIESAKLDGEQISFTVTREFQGNKFTQKYAGKISGDTIKGKIEFERNGEAQSRDWEAKREAAK